MELLYPIVSVVIVSLISVVVALPFLLHKKVSKGVLMFLLSMSVGVLLSTVFMDFLPEAFAHSKEEASPVTIGLIILLGFIIMFIIEKFVHWHHSQKCEEGECGHGHAYNLAPVNLIGDGIHNFIDGLVIAGSYAVDVSLGLSATISIVFHEIPQEIADFGVLLYSGLSKQKAMLFNFFSALTALLGVALGALVIRNLHGFEHLIVPFAAGNFIYIAASNLLPQLHRHCKLKDTVMHVFALCLGIGIIAMLVTLGPGHVHG
ncbi:ZIP family metal transporter [Candidatus Woesearchaeota archaeon]|nr:ZIP family metal transporter [Candidatus Woesearchaeota archaeon]